mmetsp:Transcript_19988/g.50927  ORF Transcript_19988/g.50927 Transcript_19988/m.50927 type:complete len:345 (-) Transcript_19988:2780-3814(-)
MRSVSPIPLFGFFRARTSHSQALGACRPRPDSSALVGRDRIASAAACLRRPTIGVPGAPIDSGSTRGASSGGQLTRGGCQAAQCAPHPARDAARESLSHSCLDRSALTRRRFALNTAAGGSSAACHWRRAGGVHSHFLARFSWQAIPPVLPRVPAIHRRALLCIIAGGGLDLFRNRISRVRYNYVRPNRKRYNRRSGCDCGGDSVPRAAADCNLSVRVQAPKRLPRPLSRAGFPATPSLFPILFPLLDAPGRVDGSGRLDPGDARAGNCANDVSLSPSPLRHRRHCPRTTRRGWRVDRGPNGADYRVRTRGFVWVCRCDLSNLVHADAVPRRNRHGENMRCRSG